MTVAKPKISSSANSLGVHKGVDPRELAKTNKQVYQLEL
jgi:hypothetical protein